MNTHVHPVFAGVLSAMQPRPYPMHAERIEWWPVGSPRIVPPCHLLVKTRREGVCEGYMDGRGTWRRIDGTAIQSQDAIAYAEMPEGPL